MINFDPYAFLADIESEGGEHSARERAVAPPAQPQRQGEVVPYPALRKALLCKATLPPEIQDLRHGFAVNGHPKTWTGKIVSLDAWRQLDEWERHGPNGRHWCGIAKAWVVPRGE
jgi:hypothetical protein